MNENSAATCFITKKIQRKEVESRTIVREKPPLSKETQEKEVEG